MCEYQRGTIECRGDGYLWDADSDGYDPDDFNDPCPNCNTAAFLAEAKEFAESTSDWMDSCVTGTGVSAWLNAVAHAERCNPDATTAALCEIGTVRALKPHPMDPTEAEEEVFTYA